MQEITERLARAERAAGSPPQYVLKLLRSIVECTRPLDIEPELMYSLEQDIIVWGVEGYLRG